MIRIRWNDILDPPACGSPWSKYRSCDPPASSRPRSTRRNDGRSWIGSEGWCGCSEDRLCCGAQGDGRSCRDIPHRQRDPRASSSQTTSGSATSQYRSSPRSRQLRVEGPDRSSGTSNSKRAALGGQTHDATQRATGKSSIHAQHLEPRARHELATYFCELPSSPSAVMHQRVSRSWKTWPVTHFVHR